MIKANFLDDPIESNRSYGTNLYIFEPKVKEDRAQRYRRLLYFHMCKFMFPYVEVYTCTYGSLYFHAWKYKFPYTEV